MIIAETIMTTPTNNTATPPPIAPIPETGIVCDDESCMVAHVGCTVIVTATVEGECFVGHRITGVIGQGLFCNTAACIKQYYIIILSYSLYHYPVYSLIFSVPSKVMCQFQICLF